MGRTLVGEDKLLPCRQQKAMGGVQGGSKVTEAGDARGSLSGLHGEVLRSFIWLWEEVSEEGIRNIK